MEEHIATNLYAAIVTATDSFQKPTTSPKTLELAAKLLTQNADKESVVQHLIKTKPLSLLKLSGRAYARLKYDEYGRIFWSLLRPLDFQDSGANIEDIGDVMHELEQNISGHNIAFLLYEDMQKKYHVYLTIGKGLIKKRGEIKETLRATRKNGALAITIEALSLEEAEEKTLTLIRTILP